MHELSIVNSLVEMATEHASAAGADRIAAVTLRIGALSCVHEDSLRFNFDLVTEDTMLAGADLQIIHVPLVIFCQLCDQEVELPGRQRLRCPRCDTPSGDIRQGRELELESIQVVENTTLST